MKSQSHIISDDISGKECEDYIEEFCPHRMSLLRFEEDSPIIFDADENSIRSDRDKFVIRKSLKCTKARSF